jgi:hypothetical protein
MSLTTTFPPAPETDHPQGFLWPRDRFHDRAGKTISITHWARLRRSREYTMIGDWSDGNGSAVRTVWTGIDVNYGYCETLMFETHCLVGDAAHYYSYATDTAARAGHDDCVGWISGNIRPSDAADTPEGIDTRAVLPLNFFDRQGHPITMVQWARLRRDPSYCVVDRWRGEGGAHVEVVWTGFDLLSGFHARPQVFGLYISAFEMCPQPDCSYRFFTEERAVKHFDRIVPMVERGVRPWEEKDVAAAGFEPLTLRAW